MRENKRELEKWRIGRGEEGLEIEKARERYMTRRVEENTKNAI